jgi:hypothetical protein
VLSQGNPFGMLPGRFDQFFSEVLHESGFLQLRTNFAPRSKLANEATALGRASPG